MNFSQDMLPENFFENIVLNTLDSRAGRFNVQSSKHYIFSIEDQYRGIKKSFIEGGLPFYFTHEETFNTACMIYERMYEKMPTSLYYFHNEEKTWNAFIVLNELDIQEHFYHPFDKPIIPENSYYPLIGALNGYGMDENPAFFLLISSPFETTRMSFLTLDSFRFLRDEDRLSCYKFKGDSVYEKIEKFAIKRAYQFKHEEKKFKELLEKYQKINLEREYFMPIILDLYNLNRNSESVKNDDKLSRAILDLRNAANFHLRAFGNTLNWTIFISFIVRYNSFELNSGIFPKHEIESLFSKKKAYTKFTEMFSRFEVDEKNFETYAKHQVSDWEKIEKIIKEK
jgi:hypothetical protein